MSYKAHHILNAMKARAYGKPFYASDLGFNGGEMNGLHTNNFVKPTGRTKTVMVPIDTWGGDRIFKECEVKEWVWCRANQDWEREWQNEAIIKAVRDAKTLLELVEEIGGVKALGIEGV